MEGLDESYRWFLDDFDDAVYEPREWSDSSDSDDELETMAILEDRVVPKNAGYFDVVETYDDVQFIEHFRVSRRVAMEVASRFESSGFYHQETGGNGKLYPMQQTLIFLWYAGHQTASFRDVADRFSITISCLHTILRRLIYFVSGLSKTVIRWPSDDEKPMIAEGFRRKGFVHNVISVVDGSHIKIDRPTEDAESYCNRKKYFSIQLQVTCDDRKKITSIFVGFPGSVHDARVFRRSPLGQNLQNRCGDYVILGDSAYPCSRNVLTPFKDTGTLNRRKKIYNRKLSGCRITIEHCIGLLKQKFRQLFHCKLRSVKDIAHFIRACCVLHNLAIEDDFPIDEQCEPMEAESTANVDDDEDELPDAPGGIEYRNYVLTSNLFD